MGCPRAKHGLRGERAMRIGGDKPIEFRMCLIVLAKLDESFAKKKQRFDAVRIARMVFDQLSKLGDRQIPTLGRVVPGGHSILIVRLVAADRPRAAEQGDGKFSTQRNRITICKAGQSVSAGERDRRGRHGTIAVEKRARVNPGRNACWHPCEPRVTAMPTERVLPAQIAAFKAVLAADARSPAAEAGSRPDRKLW